MIYRILAIVLLCGALVGLSALPAQAEDDCAGGYVALCFEPTLNILPIPILDGGAIQFGPIDRICVLPGSCPAGG